MTEAPSGGEPAKSPPLSLWFPQKGGADTPSHTASSGWWWRTAGLSQVPGWPRVCNPLPSTFAHLSSSTGGCTCRGHTALTSPEGPAAPGRAPRCGPPWGTSCGRHPVAVTRCQRCWAPRHSYSESRPCPSSLPRTSEGIRDQTSSQSQRTGPQSPLLTPGNASSRVCTCRQSPGCR